jgi:hypothetical protein
MISVILSKKLYMYMCPIPNNFQDRAISLYSSKTVGRKERFRTVSSTSIYCSSDKVGTVYLVKYILKNYTININALCKSSEDIVYSSSKCILMYSQTNVQSNSSTSETVQCRKHVHICFLSRMTDTMTSQNIDLSFWDTLYTYTHFFAHIHMNIIVIFNVIIFTLEEKC